MVISLEINEKPQETVGTALQSNEAQSNVMSPILVGRQSNEQLKTIDQVQNDGDDVVIGTNEVGDNAEQLDPRDGSADSR